MDKPLTIGLYLSGAKLDALSVPGTYQIRETRVNWRNQTEYLCAYVGNYAQSFWSDEKDVRETFPVLSETPPRLDTAPILAHLVDASRLVGEALTRRPRVLTPDQVEMLQLIEDNLDTIQGLLRCSWVKG